MNLTDFLILVVHILVIATAGLTLIFSTNIYVIGIFAFIMVALLIHTIILDRCTFCNPEERIPVINISPTKLVNQSLGVSSEIPLKDIEKIIIAVFGTLFLGKFGILLLVECGLNVSYDKFCNSLPSYAKAYLC
jgi:hypothetical protein